MKKQKLTYLLYILALCICLSTMIAGVYSIKTKLFQTKGTIGFVLHSCKVNVVGTVTGAMRGEEYGYAVVNDSTYTNQGTGNETWTDKFEKTTLGDDKNLLNDSDCWNLGEIYFDDVNKSTAGTSYLDVQLSFNIKNYSEFPIKASINIAEISGLAMILDSSELYLDAYNGSSPKTGTISCKFVAYKNNQVNLSPLAIILNFEKSVMPPLANSYGTLNSAGDTLTLNKPLVPNEEGNIVIPSLVTGNDGKSSVVKTIEIGYLSHPYQIILSQGITKIVEGGGDQAANDGKFIDSIVIPSSVTSISSYFGSSSGLRKVYEIWNQSNLSLYKNGECIAIHSNMDDSSVLKTTSEGIFYGVSDNTSVYILDLRNPANSITLPENLEGLNYTIKEYAFEGYNGTITVNSNNSIYGSNDEGTVVFKKLEGKIFWLSDMVETLNIPEGVKEILDLSSKTFTTINLPSSMTSVEGSYIPNTVTSLNVATGNTKYTSENGTLLYHMEDSIKYIDWAVGNSYEINDLSDSFKISYSSNVTWVVYNVDKALTSTQTGQYDAYGEYNSTPVNTVVFNVTNTSLKENVRGLLYSSSKYYGDSYVPTVFVKSDITDMDEVLATVYTKAESSSMEGYVEWNKK